MEEWERILDQADPQEIECMLKSVLQRYEEQFPDWQICTVSIDCREDREKQIDSMIAMLQNLKTML